LLNPGPNDPDIAYRGNEYIHVAVSWRTPINKANPDLVQMYVDGQLVANTTWLGGVRQDLSAHYPIRIGHFQNPGDQWWPGYIDEVRLWNTFRSAQDVASTYKTVLSGKESGLVAYYRMNEGSGQVLHAEGRDSSYNAYINGTAQWSNSGVQSLPADLVCALAGGDSVIPLTAVNPQLTLTSSSGLLQCDCYRTITGLPDIGSVYYRSPSTNALVPVTVGMSLPSGVSSVIYVNNVGAIPLAGHSTSISYFVTDTAGDSSAVSQAPIGVIASGECNLCNFQYDQCGTCNGNGQACNCTAGELSGTYRGFNVTELEKRLLFFEVDSVLGDLTAFVQNIMKELDYLNSVDPNSIIVEGALNALHSFNYTCVSQYVNATTILTH